MKGQTKQKNDRFFLAELWGLKLKKVLHRCFLHSLPEAPYLLFLPHQPFLASYALWFSERKSSSPSEETSTSAWAQIPRPGWSQELLSQVIQEMARSHLSPSDFKPSMSHPWRQRMGMLMLAQFVQFQVVLAPLWFRANEQRGMTKPGSALPLSFSSCKERSLCWGLGSLRCH